MKCQVGGSRMLSTSLAMVLVKENFFSEVIVLVVLLHGENANASNPA